MADSKLLGALSLAKRAGALAAGFDETARAAEKGKARLVLLARDTSEGTQKRVRLLCQSKCPVRVLPLTQYDTAAITRKPVGVLAITDTNLAALCLRECPGLPDEEEPV